MQLDLDDGDIAQGFCNRWTLLQSSATWFMSRVAPCTTPTATATFVRESKIRSGLGTFNIKGVGKMLRCSLPKTGNKLKYVNVRQ